MIFAELKAVLKLVVSHAMQRPGRVVFDEHLNYCRRVHRGVGRERVRLPRRPVWQHGRGVRWTLRGALTS